MAGMIGYCVDDESHAENGDAVQHSTGGLLVWRKADDWTAFTDGYRTWINGPYGLSERLNSQRFSWESNPDGLPSADNQPAPDPVVPSSLTSGMTRLTRMIGMSVDWAGSHTSFRTTIDDAYATQVIPASREMGRMWANPGYTFIVLLTTTVNTGSVSEAARSPIRLASSGDTPISPDMQTDDWVEYYFGYVDHTWDLTPGDSERNTDSYAVFHTSVHDVVPTVFHLTNAITAICEDGTYVFTLDASAACEGNSGV